LVVAHEVNRFQTQNNERSKCEKYANNIENSGRKRQVNAESKSGNFTGSRRLVPLYPLGYIGADPNTSHAAIV
jgi:hypothetical protein